MIVKVKRYSAQLSILFPIKLRPFQVIKNKLNFELSFTCNTFAMYYVQYSKINGSALKMENSIQKKQHSKWLLFLGVLLFLLGLLIGLFIPMMANSRMALSAHLEGTINGMFLVILGLIWNKLLLNDKWSTAAFWLALYGSFANFVAVTIAAVTGAGKMMPIAGGKEGATVVEGFISFLLVSLALAMIFVCLVVLTGLFRYLKQE